MTDTAVLQPEGVEEAMNDSSEVVHTVDVDDSTEAVVTEGPEESRTKGPEESGTVEIRQMEVRVEEAVIESEEQHDVVEGAVTESEEQHDVVEGAVAGSEEQLDVVEGTVAGSEEQHDVVEAAVAGSEEQHDVVEGTVEGSEEQHDVVEGAVAGSEEQHDVGEGEEIAAESAVQGDQNVQAEPVNQEDTTEAQAGEVEVIPAQTAEEKKVIEQVVEDRTEDQVPDITGTENADAMATSMDDIEEIPTSEEAQQIGEVSSEQITQMQAEELPEGTEVDEENMKSGVIEEVKVDENSNVEEGESVAEQEAGDTEEAGAVETVQMTEESAPLEPAETEEEVEFETNENIEEQTKQTQEEAMIDASPAVAEEVEAIEEVDMEKEGVPSEEQAEGTTAEQEVTSEVHEEETEQVTTEEVEQIESSEVEATEVTGEPESAPSPAPPTTELPEKEEPLIKEASDVPSSDIPGDQHEETPQVENEVHDSRKSSLAKDSVAEEAAQLKSETPYRRTSEASLKKSSGVKASSRRSSTAEEKPESRKGSIVEEEVRKISFADQNAQLDEKPAEEKSASRRSSETEKVPSQKTSIEEKVPPRRDFLKEKPKKTKGLKTKSKLGRKSHKAEAEEKPESKPELEPEVEPEPELELKTEPQLESEPKPETEAEGELETAPTVEADTKMEAEPEPEAEQEMAKPEAEHKEEAEEFREIEITQDDQEPEVKPDAAEETIGDKEQKDVEEAKKERRTSAAKIQEKEQKEEHVSPPRHHSPSPVKKRPERSPSPVKRQARTTPPSSTYTPFDQDTYRQRGPPPRMPTYSSFSSYIPVEKSSYSAISPWVQDVSQKYRNDYTATSTYRPPSSYTTMFDDIVNSGPFSMSLYSSSRLLERSRSRSRELRNALRSRRSTSNYHRYTSTYGTAPVRTRDYSTPPLSSVHRAPSQSGSFISFMEYSAEKQYELARSSSRSSGYDNLSRASSRSNVDLFYDEGRLSRVDSYVRDLNRRYERNFPSTYEKYRSYSRPYYPYEYTPTTGYRTYSNPSSIERDSNYYMKRYAWDTIPMVRSMYEKNPAEHLTTSGTLGHLYSGFTRDWISNYGTNTG